MLTSVLKALPGKLDFKRHESSILYLLRTCTYIWKGRILEVLYFTVLKCKKLLITPMLSNPAKLEMVILV